MSQIYKSKISRGWLWGSAVLALVAMLPLGTVFLSWFLPISEHWTHLSDVLLPSLLGSTFILLFWVLLFSGLLGVVCAWCVTHYDFPGRNFFNKALILPMAVPAYVNGFVYLGFWDYSGTLYEFLRSFGWEGRPFFEVRSILGCSWVLSMGLFPYVFLLCKQGFESQGGRLMEAGRSLGLSSFKVFGTLAVPMARPWIVGSLALVGMETLADFGTVSIFGVDTFTTAIYKSWYGFFSPETAAQLSSLLLGFVALFFYIDHFSRNKRRYDGSGGHYTRLCLRRSYRYLMTFCFGLLFLASFLGPVTQLLFWAAKNYNASLSLLTITMNSGLIASCASLVVVVQAMILVFGKRFFPGPKQELVNRLAVFGYGIPGTVLAIGVFLPLTFLDNSVADAIEGATGYDVGLLLTGGLGAMVFGLSIRYLAVGYTSIQSAIERVSPRIDEAAVNHGVYGMEQIRLVHLPIIWRSVMGAGTLVFIDVIKEMPLTLMTRPFGWDTLSVRIFELVSEGEWHRAAVPASILALLGLVPVLLMKEDEKP